MTSFNHPCEILSDVYSIRRLRSDYEHLTYTFVGGDGNIINSWKAAGRVLGLKINHVSLPEYRIGEDSTTYAFFTDLDDALKGTDVVLTDPLPSALRNESYYNKYQITLDRMKSCKEGACLNPCPPFYRGEEVSTDVIDSDFFVGHDFKKNLIYVQQAIILYLLNIKID
jgi:ornithine carbamoyltransferase